MKCANSGKKSVFDTYIFIVLVCLEVLMSFTFLGYIHVPPISVTFAYIPILIAACLLGTAQSTVIGVAFGLASMYKSSAHYVMPSDMIFSPVLTSGSVGDKRLPPATIATLAREAFNIAQTIARAKGALAKGSCHRR